MKVVIRSNTLNENGFMTYHALKRLINENSLSIHTYSTSSVEQYPHAIGDGFFAEHHSLMLPRIFKLGQVFVFDLEGDYRHALTKSEIKNMRTEPLLIDVIETEMTKDKHLGIGIVYRYKVVDIPDDISWDISTCEYDGSECVVESHRSWC